MRLAVFGGTGTVGRPLVTKALAAGHDVRMLARTPSRVGMTHPALTVVAGDARDPAAVGAVVAGSEAVVSMLGGFSDTDSIQLGTAAITAAMAEYQLRRVIVVQGYHLDFPGDPHNVGRRLILPMLYLGSRTLIPDSRAMAAAIQRSGLEWTVVRVPRIVLGPSTGSTRIGSLPLGPWDSVTSGDVADLVLSCLDDADTVRTAPMVAAARRSERRSPAAVIRTLRDIVRPPGPGAGQRVKP